MVKPRIIILCSLMLSIAFMATQANALIPYTRSSLLDMVLPTEDPFRILEQTLLTILKGMETLALARADWKETTSAYVITLDILGMKKDDVKIEVEENKVLRVSRERRSEEEVERDKWHRAERTSGKFWRQLRLPMNADLDHVKAHLEDGVLRITNPKLVEEKKRQPKVINIAEESSSPSREDIKATKAEM